MRITDSQVHVITRHTPERPWLRGDGELHGWREFTVERLLAEMDAAGVARAVVVPPSTEGDRNDTSLQAARAHPDRLKVVGRLDITAPSSRTALASWLDEPAMAGLRVTFNRAWSAAWLTDGTADWLWPAAEAAGIPLYAHVPGQVRLLGPVARRHPGLKLIVDHLGVGAGARPDAVEEAVGDLVALAREPNVAVKASAVPTLTEEPYPFASTHHWVRAVVDAYGPRRVFWGSDITRLRCPYRECVSLFTEQLDFLSNDDLTWIMGRALGEWLNWP